jgi:hypothetical protein
VIPNAVKVIMLHAFIDCERMSTVTLGEGLEKIEWCASENCTSLERIVIPPAVKDIDDSAFRSCSNLTNTVFCDEIEEIVPSGATRDWWNQDIHERSVTMYCF